MSDPIRDIAEQMASLQGNVSGLLRARQLPRSSISTTAGEVPVADVLGDAAEVAADYPSQVEAVDALDGAQSSDLDAIASAGEDTEAAEDEAHEARMAGIEIELEVQAAMVELQQALAESASALEEAGLARSEAAGAVQDAAAAVAQAGQALSDAAAAAADAATANGRITLSGQAPTAADGDGRPVGALWMRRDTGVEEMWEWTALGWIPRPLEETIIPQIAIGTGTYGDLSGGRLTALSVTAVQLAAGAVVAEKLAANAVTAVKIAANSVIAEKIQAGAVTTDKLNALAVTAEKLAAGSIIAEKIAAGAITTSKLAATAIDGMTITGAIIRTAASGQRIQIDVAGLKAYNAAGSQTALISADAGGLLLSGGLSAYTGGNNPRAQLNSGQLLFDYPSSPGAGTLNIGPGFITQGGAGVPLEISHPSSGAGSGISISGRDNRITTDNTLTLLAGSNININPDGRIGSNRSLNILWEGAIYMSDTQTANLAETVSTQLNGIILEWSGYASGAATNTWWNYTHVPKAAVNRSGSMSCVIQNSQGTTYKPIGIFNSYLTGHSANSTAPQSSSVLRRVYGY